MARPNRIAARSVNTTMNQDTSTHAAGILGKSVDVATDNITEYERHRQINIEENNRKFRELGLPTRKIIKNSKQMQPNMGKDTQYCPEDEILDMDLDDALLSPRRSLMPIPTLERQVTLTRKNIDNDHRTSSESQARRTRSNLSNGRENALHGALMSNTTNDLQSIEDENRVNLSNQEGTVSVDSLRKMARTKRIPARSVNTTITQDTSTHATEILGKSVDVAIDNITEYERRRQINIEENNRKFRELGLPTRKIVENSKQTQPNMGKDTQYCPEDEILDMDLDDALLSPRRSLMPIPTLERQVTLTRKNIDNDHRTSSELQARRTRSYYSHKESDSNFSNGRGNELHGALMSNTANELQSIEDENRVNLSNQEGSSLKRGKTKCQNWKRKRDVDPRKLDFEVPLELKRVVGIHSTQFISEASYLMKQCMPLDVEKWDDIHQDKKRKYFMKLKGMFEFPKGSHVENAIERRCKVWYRKWCFDLKQKAYESYKTVVDRQNNPPKEVDPDEWKWLVKYWDSDKFRRRSETNTKNQQSQKMLAKVGTKSIASTSYDMLNKSVIQNDESNVEHTELEEEEPYYLRLWEIQRRKKDGTWCDDHAEIAYEKLQELHQTQLEEYGVDDLTPQEAFTRVLKQKKGSHHQRGMGQGVLPYITYEKYVSSEAEIQARVDAEVHKRISQINESYEARLQAIEEKVSGSSSAQLQTNRSSRQVRSSSTERTPSG